MHCVLYMWNILTLSVLPHALIVIYSSKESASLRQPFFGMFQENSMCIIYSETDHQPRLDAWDKCSGLVHWEDPEESGGEGGGRGDQDGEYM